MKRGLVRDQLADSLACVAMALTLAHAPPHKRQRNLQARAWEGAVTVQGKELRIEVDLLNKASNWVGTAAFPDMNAKGLVLSPITVQGEAVTFSVKGAPGDPTFKGTLSKDSKTLAGDFTQGPVSGKFTLAWKGEAKYEAPPKNAALGKEFEGAWEGTLEVSGMALRLTLNLANQDGGATGMLVSINQGGAQIPLSSIVQTGTHLKFTGPRSRWRIRRRPEGWSVDRHVGTPYRDTPADVQARGQITRAQPFVRLDEVIDIGDRRCWRNRAVCSIVTIGVMLTATGIRAYGVCHRATIARAGDPRRRRGERS